MAMQDKTLEKIAAALYEPKLPYHNFGHAITVTRFSAQLIEQCCRENVPLDEKVVYYALLFHDAGYQHDHHALGFDSKEAYSADLSEHALRDYGVDVDVINKVKKAILATHIDGTCESNEDKAVRASDLSGLAAGYDVFKANAIKLREEQEMMSGQSPDWSTYTASVRDTVRLFLREELELTSDYFDENNNSVFHTKVEENIQILLSDNSPTM
ncbi:MAG: HD domain-containing protein [Gammaproteobacteria bacterium]|nr:HD domain-containing protein [Gammaproteobacteria bacterium]